MHWPVALAEATWRTSGLFGIHLPLLRPSRRNCTITALRNL